VEAKLIVTQFRLTGRDVKAITRKTPWQRGG
jgi:hypothetical protein